MKRRFFTTAQVLSLFGMVSSSLAGATFHVDDDNCPGPGIGSVANPFCSIQACIDASVAGDECVVEPGMYNECIDILGKEITVRSSGGRDVTTIAGTGSCSVVRCINGEGPATLLEGFRITGGVGLGAGMYNFDSNPTVRSCLFFENTGSNGSGMYNEGSSPLVSDCIFLNNAAANDGGAVVNQASTARFERCVFLGNLSSQDGGAMRCLLNSDVTISNCLFNKNSAGRHGGAIVLENSTVAITNSTFVSNTAAQFGGGIRVGFQAFTSAMADISNSIFWNNSDIGGMDATAQIDVLSGSATVRYSDVKGDWPGNGNINANPMFVDPDGVDNILGTEDDDLRLLLDGSPCIDTGDNASLLFATTTDLDGNPRIVSVTVDMGAFENQTGTPASTGACCVFNTCKNNLYEEPCLAGSGHEWHGEIGCNEANCGAIPAVSEWGLAVLALLVLSAGSVILLRSRGIVNVQ